MPSSLELPYLGESNDAPVSRPGRNKAHMGMFVARDPYEVLRLATVQAPPTAGVIVNHW